MFNDWFEFALMIEYPTYGSIIDFDINYVFYQGAYVLFSDRTLSNFSRCSGVRIILISWCFLGLVIRFSIEF